METFTPTQLFFAACVASALTAIGSRMDQGPLSIPIILNCVLFHGSIGGGLGIGLYEFLAWKWQFRWALAPIVSAIAYGGGIVKIPKVNLRDVLLRALGSSSGGNNGDKGT